MIKNYYVDKSLFCYLKKKIKNFEVFKIRVYVFRNVLVLFNVCLL